MRDEKNSLPVRLFRLLRFLAHVIQGLATVGLIFPFLSPLRRTRLVRRWAAGILDIFQVRVTIRGAVPQPDAIKTVFVANHVSWLDPALIMALRPAHFVAKSDIRAWPVLGWLAAKAGTLFIERHRRHDTSRVIQSLSQALNAGDCVGVFPEGTTTDGTTLKPFHSSLLQAAVVAEATVHPVAIRYRRPDGALDPVPVYSGNITFVRSLLRVLAQRETQAELVFAAPIPARGKSRHELARLSEEAITNALSLAGPCRRPGKPAGLPGAGRTGALPTDNRYPGRSDCCALSGPAPTNARK
jgi:1-acyl-sn-glycerol-3-phosphate acyltransferase